MGVDELAEAIRAAERYPSLAAEVEAARGLKERWIKRAEAQAHFDAAVERLSGPAAGELLRRPAGGGAAAAPELAADAFWSELNARLAELEAATEEARQANIGVARAKRVLKELQAQVRLGGWGLGLRPYDGSAVRHMASRQAVAAMAAAAASWLCPDPSTANPNASPGRGGGGRGPAGRGAGAAALRLCSAQIRAQQGGGGGRCRRHGRLPVCSGRGAAAAAYPGAGAGRLARARSAMLQSPACSVCPLPQGCRGSSALAFAHTPPACHLPPPRPPKPSWSSKRRLRAWRARLPAARAWPTCRGWRLLSLRRAAWGRTSSTPTRTGPRPSCGCAWTAPRARAPRWRPRCEAWTSLGARTTQTRVSVWRVGVWCAAQCAGQAPAPACRPALRLLHASLVDACLKPASSALCDTTQLSAVERCIEEAEACDELLLPEAARAREAVHRWRVAAAAEARLTRALRDGVGPTVLGRAIKEAAAAGCKVRAGLGLCRVCTHSIASALHSRLPTAYPCTRCSKWARRGGC